MMDHVEDVHLKYLSPKDIICLHPACKSKSGGVALDNINSFKSHVKRVHGIKLRDPRYTG